jgi:glycerol kinase
MAKLILAIDEGTTGTTALLLNRNLKVLGRATVEFPQIFPQPGWVEHNPTEIMKSVGLAVKKALKKAKAKGKDVAAIGITNQRETTVLWDKKTNEPVHNAIVWQCRRTADICNELKKKGHLRLVRNRTGLVLDPYFSGTKLTWIFRNNKKLAKRAARGELAFGTIDSFVVSQLSGGTAHVTDVSNASRTLLFNIKTLKWDAKLADMLEVPMEILPEVRSCSEVYGETYGLSFLPDGIPICGMAGDQQAALFGQACFEPGSAKTTFGTGSFTLLNTGDKPVMSKNGMLTTVGWTINGKTTYALEGSAFIAGAAVQWLRDGMQLFDDAPKVEKLAAKVDSSDGVYFVPALVGLGAPHWRPEARGVITGLTRGTTRAHIARATLEGIAFSVYDIVSAMEAESKISLKELKVDGGACANNLLMQFQSDILGNKIVRPKLIETTALGAAFLAGLSAGIWKSQNDIKKTWKQDRVFSPMMKRSEARKLIAGWQEAVKKA